MILTGKKFYTIKTPIRSIVLWVDEDREFPNPPDSKSVEIKESSQDEKAYWLENMNKIDEMVKNDFMGVTLKYFEKWKKTKV
jgi:hypothetical protein